jgi:hypothetical protein
MSGLNYFRDTFQTSRPSRRRSLLPAVEGLDQRALLSAGLGYTLAAGQFAEVRRERQIEFHGTVVKTPRFYEDYVGPRLAQLDVMKATGTLLRDGNFRFLGVTQGVIDPNVRATYVIGVDRNGHLPTGPFPGRPDIRFDATVVIKIVPGQASTVTVNDLANKTSKTLQNPALQISGRKIEVQIAGNLLPSTGLAPSHFQYNLWPEDGLPGSTNIASFAPESHDIRVGIEPRLRVGHARSNRRRTRPAPEQKLARCRIMLLAS